MVIRHCRTPTRNKCLTPSDLPSATKEDCASARRLSPIFRSSPGHACGAGSSPPCVSRSSWLPTLKTATSWRVWTCHATSEITTQGVQRLNVADMEVPVFSDWSCLYQKKDGDITPLPLDSFKRGQARSVVRQRPLRPRTHAVRGPLSPGSRPDRKGLADRTSSPSLPRSSRGQKNAEAHDSSPLGPRCTSAHLHVSPLAVRLVSPCHFFQLPSC